MLKIIAVPIPSSVKDSMITILDINPLIPRYSLPKVCINTALEKNPRMAIMAVPTTPDKKL
jgi:hypothetical protein